MGLIMSYETAISLPMRLDSYGSIATTIDPRKIYSDRVTSTIGTMLGERVNRPAFGTRVARQWMTNLYGIESSIESEIQTAFIEFLPLLTLLETTFEDDSANGVLKVIITYSLPNDEENTAVIALVGINRTQPQYQENI